MVKALFWKEWRRLRAVRFTMTGIGLAMPAVFALAVWAASHGWGMRALTGYSMRTILLEAVPAALYLGLWPLAALVLVVQAFTADRAEGTETFLLDRAVPRRSIWWARWMASLGSLTVVVVVGGGMLLAFLASYPDSTRSFARYAVFLGLPGLILMVATSLAGLGATALLSAPLPAFLVALLLTAFPVLAGAGGSLIFPYARWGMVPLAAVTACALALVMPLASWTADTHGEPAGRGRRLRAALVLSGGLVLATAAFVVLAPLAVRAGAPKADLSVVPAPGGTTTLVLGERGLRPMTQGKAMSNLLGNGPAGFLVDLRDGRMRGFLAPEVQWAQWNDTGTKLVVLDNSRPFGSIGSSRIRFLDGVGREIWSPIEEPDGFAVRQATWVGERVVIVYGALEDTTMRVDVLDPAAHKQGTVLQEQGPGWVTLHDAKDGRVLVFSMRFGKRTQGASSEVDRGQDTWSLRPLDLGEGRVGPAILEGHGTGQGGLSPSGRYWLQRTRTSSVGTRLEVIELANGAVTALPAPHRTQRIAWTRDDRVVWLQHGDAGWSLFRMDPAGSPGVWATGPERDPLLQVSPDGALALVSLLGPGGRGKQAALLLRAGGDEAPRVLEDLASFDMSSIDWAGPHTLAVTGRGRLSLHDVTTGKGTVVF
ncbi:MAG TPA: ABC transporter permease [Candidatus Polarisedimenticolaceae bacterium]|nr:ABC transporter permease [Candidatus Polarisedimenticolaceae bacterium]